MLRFLMQRLLALVPVLFTVAVIVFLILRLTPGDPAAVIAGNNATNEDIDRIREQLGLSQPLWTQFWIWFMPARAVNKRTGTLWTAQDRL